MNHFYRSLVAFCLFGYGTILLAQSTVPAAGGYALSPGNSSVSYTVGQVFYTTLSGTGTINQGIQLPFEISVATVIKEAEEIVLEVLIYPNPTDGLLNLKVEKYDSDNLRYKLIEMNGTLIQENKVDGHETRIQLGNIAPGIYLLKIVDNNKEIKIFKIIKN